MFPIQPDKDLNVDSILTLADACKSFYKFPTPEPCEGDRSTDDNVSTTSSVSDSISGSSEDDEMAKPYMAMCEALSLCKQPRCVVG